MPPPVYVKSLFALLRALGVTQQAVAVSLGVSKGLVSLWSQGKIPLAKHHLRAFFTLVANAIDEALPPSSRHMLTGADLAPDPSPRRILLHTVSEYLDQWGTEQYDKMGLLGQSYQSAYDVIVSYRKQDPRKLDSAQREEISEACRNILRVNRALEMLHELPRKLDFNHLQYSYHIPDDVLSFLWGMAGWHSAWGTPPPNNEGEEDINDA